VDQLATVASEYIFPPNAIHKGKSENTQSGNLNNRIPNLISEMND